MPDAPVREGDILAGKYKIERVLAKGGMGVVVAALHEQLEQRVALKFLLPEGASDESAIGRFLREARAAVRLRSEHVAKVLDVGTLDTGSPYIVMEYLDGRDLQAVLAERGKLTQAVAVSHLLQACEAIAEAHALGIVHRDLKPANLFLTRRNDGSPCIKVLDFGISRLANRVDGLTKTSVLMGSPYYMSPQQMRSSRDADARCDIWALGMILYELLTGIVAFPRETLPELCASIIYDPVPHPSSHGVDVAPELVEVITRCLEKDPALRYQNLAQLAQALAPFTPDGPASAERIQRILDPAARSLSSPPMAQPSDGTKTQISGSLPNAAGEASAARSDEAPAVQEFAAEDALATDVWFEPAAPRKPAWLIPFAIAAGAGAVVLGSLLFFSERAVPAAANASATRAQPLAASSPSAPPTSAGSAEAVPPSTDSIAPSATSVVTERSAEISVPAAAKEAARRDGSISIHPRVPAAPTPVGDFGPRK